MLWQLNVTSAVADELPKITLSLKNVDLVTAFEIIADKVDLNLIADKAIDETVSLSVSHVDALKLMRELADSYGLTLRMTDNLIQVTRSKLLQLTNRQIHLSHCHF